MNSRGFTLIELIIVLLMIGILAAIAIPNYSSYVAKSNRKELVQELTQAVAKQEQIFSDTRRYSKKTAQLGIPKKYTAGRTSDKFKISVYTNKEQTQFKLVAVPIGNMKGFQAENDKSCISFLYGSHGTKSGNVMSSKKLITSTKFDDIKIAKSDDSTEICVGG